MSTIRYQDINWQHLDSYTILLRREIDEKRNFPFKLKTLREFKIDGKYHREDGPAIEREDGTKEWWLNGKLHRADGPAVEYPNGDKEWYLNNNLHREDGPAIECSDGYKFYQN